MGQGQSGRNTYDNYYNALQQNRTIDLSQISPYDILGVSNDFTWDDLVKAYRKTALKVHPDKGGSEMLFNVATSAFKTLAKEYKRREIEKPHDVLKKDFKEYENSNEKTFVPPPIIQEKGTGTFNQKFNKFFQENKIDDDDEDNRGYSHLMEKSTKERGDIHIPKIIKKFNEAKFNSTFEKVVKPVSNEVIVYKEPEPLILAKNLNFTELGVKTKEFSTDPTKSNILQYTDYQKAHTTQRLIDPRAISKRKEYKTVTDYEADRQTITQTELDAKEIAYQKEKELRAQQEEELRIKRIQERDERTNAHYEKINQLMLGLR